MFLLMCLILGSTALQAQDAREIIRKSEEKRRGVSSSKAEMTMTIIRPEWTRSMSLKAWSKGDDYALVVVTAPARDQGSVTLKRGKEVWNWMPRVERTVKLPPSMMSQSWMGSDFTNNDLVQEVSLVDDYTQKVLKDSTIEGRPCWKIEMVPLEETAVIWSKVHLFVDKKDYLQLRSEFFDEDGYRVTIMQGSGIKTMGGRIFVSRLEMVPLDKKGQKTILEYSSLVFDQAIPETFFSVQNMSKASSF